MLETEAQGELEPRLVRPRPVFSAPRVAPCVCLETARGHRAQQGVGLGEGTQVAASRVQQPLLENAPSC